MEVVGLHNDLHKGLFVIKGFLENFFNTPLCTKTVGCSMLLVQMSHAMELLAMDGRRDWSPSHDERSSWTCSERIPRRAGSRWSASSSKKSLKMGGTAAALEFNKSLEKEMKTLLRLEKLKVRSL